MGNVLQEVLAWSVGRPDWQRDCLRRLVADGELEPTDLDELLRLSKKPHGLLPDGDDIAAIELREGHLPAAPLEGRAVSLMAVEGAVHVNALAQGQRVVFAPLGLTVVYGDNASGKSGYARVLKAACRARGAADAILPNVTAQAPGGTPTATICWLQGDEEKKAPWLSAATPPAELSNVSIFDSKSAAAYVSQRNDVAYRPLGLDLFDHLADACDHLRRRLDVEMGELQRAAIALPSAAPETAAGKFLQRITGLTDEATLDALLLTKEEASELGLLRAQLAELEVANPAARLAQLQQRLHRAEVLQRFVVAVVQRLGAGGLVALQEARDSLAAARGAVALTAAELKDEPIAKVGEAAWRTLWDAASRYIADATPGAHFPVADHGAKCALCQATLDEDARARLQRFQKFIEGDASKAADKATRRLAESRQQLAKLSFDHASIRGGLADLADATWAPDLNDWLSLATAVRDRALEAIDDDAQAALPPPVLAFDFSGAEKTIADWKAALSLLKNAAYDVGAKRKIAARISELSGKATITDRHGDIVNEIKRRRRIAAYAQCRRDLETAMITRKSTELTQQYVSAKLQMAFTLECERLRFRTVEVDLKPAGGERGSLYHQVRLRQTSRVALPDVLSEGEARCLSIAAFFAELELIEPRSGMVFDDPVSSLDHHWRDAVAERLVTEAARRQVVVFTHDVFFLFLLQNAAKAKGVPLHHQHLTRGVDGAGICTGTLPWAAMKTTQRIGALKAAWQGADALERRATRADYEKEAASIYGLLREAWERAIEEVLLNEVVARFRLSVETQRASKIHDITQADLQEMEAAMSKCSTWLTGHDHAVGLRVPMPAAADLKADLEVLANWVDRIKRRRAA